MDAQGVLPSPMISVGIPVYNGERFLARAIDSVLAQTCSDWELIISDNASVDGTESIARAYAERDFRIRYLRQAVNLGVSRNLNALFAAGHGRYFKWLSANDWLAPDALRACSEVLEKSAEVVVCFGGVRLVDEATGEQSDADDDYQLDADDPVERFAAHCLPYPKWNPFNGGVYRSAALATTGLHRDFGASDLVLNAEMAIRGKFVRIAQVATYETFGATTATKFRNRGQITAFFNPTARGPDKFMYTRAYLAYLGVALGGPLGYRDRLRAAMQVARRMRWDQRRVISEVVRCLRLSRSWG